MIRSNTAIRGTTVRSDEMKKVLLGLTLQLVFEEGAKRLTSWRMYCWVNTTNGITRGGHCNWGIGLYSESPWIRYSIGDDVRVLLDQKKGN